MKILYKNVNELKEYENNPRFNDKAVESVKKSIEEFGFKIPILIDKNNVIIAGHTRFKAAKQLEIEEVPCILCDDLSPEQVKAFRLVDNKTAEFSVWDMDKLIDELKEIADSDMNDIFDFPDVTLDELNVNDEDFLKDTEIVKDRNNKKPLNALNAEKNLKYEGISCRYRFGNE